LHNEQKKRPYRILLVDDELNILNSLKRLLIHEGYEILTALSGQKALDILKAKPVHLIIADQRMPGMTGTELIRRIKEAYPETVRILLTAYADFDVAIEAINRGAIYKILSKPWQVDDFKKAVAEALQQCRAHGEDGRSISQDVPVTPKRTKLDNYTTAGQSLLGNILIKRKHISRQDLDKALEVQAKTKKILPVVITEAGITDEQTIIESIVAETRVKRISLKDYPISKETAELIPGEICKKNILIPLKLANKRLTVVMADPTDFMLIDDLRFLTGFSIEPVIAGLTEIEQKIQELFEVAEPLKGFPETTEALEFLAEEEENEPDAGELLTSPDLPEAIRTVNGIIAEGLRLHASDIHIEPRDRFVMVRYRIDGLLQDRLHLPLSIYPSIVSRIKVMSELDISERRLPQDGRITVKNASKTVDLRISTLPTINGEKIVLRILDKNSAIKDIQDLGFSESDLKRVSRFMAMPQGVVLATGPTGSGKTSTLYSLLQANASITKNYATVEDPVEYHMGLAAQVNVKENIGLKFSNVLRAFLRQDPNVIMVGEIRDLETAEVAFHAALTGHLVISTLHTNGSIVSITRLRDMGVPSYVICDALVGIIAQRLVRRICPHCKTDDNPAMDKLCSLRLKAPLDFSPKKGAGCARCNSSGYKGRIGLFEVFEIDDELKGLIYSGASEKELLKAARWGGMKTLFEDAMDKVRSGITTLDEVLRVLGPQNRLEIECANCQARLEERFPFCPYCGHPLVLRCSGCGRTLENDWKNCAYCGMETSFGKNSDVVLQTKAGLKVMRHHETA